jgi:glyoxylase-like metal-dependent hydrolase (beta-lactamase superfamily II)
MPPIISRRDVLSAAAGLACAGLFTRLGHAMTPEPSPDRFFDWSAPTTGAFLASKNGGNSLLVVHRGESLLIDAKHAPWGQALHREVLVQLGRGATLTAVANTHHHSDHTGGNHAFSSLTPKIPILAHNACTPRVLAQKDRYISAAKDQPQAVPETGGPALQAARRDAVAFYRSISARPITDFCPTLTFEQSHELKIGGLAIELRHLGPGHTDNDLIIIVKDLNLIATGDLLFVRSHAFVDPDGGGSLAQWLARLEDLRALCTPDTILIPGHGVASTPSAIDEQKTYLTTMRDEVSRALERGVSRDAISRLDPAPFRDYALPQLRSSTLLAIASELRASHPPRNPPPR